MFFKSYKIKKYLVIVGATLLTFSLHANDAIDASKPKKIKGSELESLLKQIDGMPKDGIKNFVDIDFRKESIKKKDLKKIVKSLTKNPAQKVLCLTSHQFDFSTIDKFKKKCKKHPHILFIEERRLNWVDLRYRGSLNGPGMQHEADDSSLASKAQRQTLCLFFICLSKDSTIVLDNRGFLGNKAHPGIVILGTPASTRPEDVFL